MLHSVLDDAEPSAQRGDLPICKELPTSFSNLRITESGMSIYRLSEEHQRSHGVMDGSKVVIFCVALQGSLIQFKSATLPKGTYVKIQPHTTDFLDISNPKAVLETSLRQEFDPLL